MRKRVLLLLAACAVLLSAVPVFAAAPDPNDWLGEWAFTFEGSTTSLVRFDDLCVAPSCPQGTYWAYIAHGQKADGTPIQVRKITFAPTDSFYYELTDAEITVCGSGCPNSQIPDANYNNTDKTFTVSAYTGPPVNKLVSGAKDIGCVDADLDGYGTGCNAGSDCNDNDPAIHPGVADNTCNGIDENCSGAADEGYVPDSSCFLPGACAAGNVASSCSGGIETPCATGTPSSDANCDGIDNNCNGQTDEGYVSVPTTCGVGACAGNTGSTSCVAGSVADSCDPFAGATADTNCDGIDNNCNGSTDEGYVVDSSCFLPGACAAGDVASSCSGGIETPCETGTPTAEVCDGIDNNCDGVVDEGFGNIITYYRDADNDNFGNAAINLDASDCAQPAGYVTDNTDCNDNNSSINPGATEVCNGIDDDCDGVIDNGFEAQFHSFYRDADGDGYGNTALSIPACAAPPGYVDNSTGFDCNDNNSAINPGASDANCDGIDNNCNGQTDEGYVSVPTACGVGACAGNTGSTSCVGGSIADSCDPLAGATPDTNCDGIDNNCNGQTDEGYVIDSSCFLPGACAAGNVASSCTGGVETPCATGTPSSDANCDGIDNNCNGQTDEGYVSVPTACGAGACAAAGSTSCVAGQVEDSCTPGSSTAEVCNGIDDDCDGEIDNDLVFKTYYRDADNDTYGNADNATVACEEPEGYVDNSTGFDCNDNDSAVNPGETEVCDDGIDNNCNGQIDENCNTDNCTDADADGYFAGEGCTPFDCDDSNWKIHEGCEADPCSLKIVPKQIVKFAKFFVPFGAYLITADQASGTDFGTFKVRFESDAIHTINGVRIGTRTIIGFYRVNPFKLETGDTKAEVEIYGDSPEILCADFIVK